MVLLTSLPCGLHAQSASTLTLTVTSGGSPVSTLKQGAMITLTATVTAGGAPVTPGQVNFCEVKPAPLRCTDIRLLSTQQLLSNGVATFSFYPGSGAHTYQATFLGTHAAAGSSAQSSLTVTPDSPTITTLTNIGSMAVTVTGNGGIAPPTGTITFEDADNADYVLGTAQLVPNSAPGGGLSFSSPVAIQQYSIPNLETLGLAVADFNNDGRLDISLGLLAGGNYRDLVTVLAGSNGTTFSAPIYSPIAYSVVPLWAADFNNDGKQDLLLNIQGVVQGVVASLGVEVFTGNGDGTFNLPTSGLPLQADVAIGDFNRDGILDLAAPTPEPLGTVTLYLGRGDGSFAPGQTYPVGASPDAIAAADLNGDGNLDLVVANQGSSTATVLLGKGDGTFTLASTLQTVAEPIAVAVADFNGDGIPDLALEGAGTQATIAIYLGNGSGGFTPAPQGLIYNAALSGTASFGPIAVGDPSGDGIPALVTGSATASNAVLAFLGNGDGSFQSPASLTVDGVASNSSIVPSVTGISLADLNGDGLSDIAVGGGYDKGAYVVLSELAPQPATATLADPFIVGTGSHHVVAVYSGDSNYQPSTSASVLFPAQLEPTTLSLTSNPTTSSYGQQVVLIADILPNTAQNHSPTGAVTFTLGNTVLGTANLSGGIATLNVTSLPRGTDIVYATYPGDRNFVTSGGSATQVVNGYSNTTALAATPNPAGLGQTLTITATVAGIGTSLVPTGTVTFFDGAAQLGAATLDAAGHGTYTSSTLALGVHSLTAAYSGSAAFIGSSSTAFAETIIKPDFSVTLALPSITLAKYQHTTTSVILAPIGGFSDTLTLSCGALPTYLTCLPTPTSTPLPPNSTVTASLYLDTDSLVGGHGNGPLAKSSGSARLPVDLALLLSPAFFLAAQRRPRSPKLFRALLAILALPVALALTSCGGNQITPVPGVGPGTYIIPITAAGTTTAITHTANLTLQITP